MKQVILMSIMIVCMYALDDDPCAEELLRTYNVTCTNWTTCDTFLANSSFDSNSVLNIDWKIFYMWNFQYEDSYNMRFSKPSPMLVDRFMALMDRDVNQTINWNDTELFVETSVDISGVLIRTKTPGIFNFILAPLLHFRSIPNLLFAFKLVDGYLGIMNCLGQIAYALAPVERMPEPDQLEEAAYKINFWNPLGRSYLVKINDTVEENIPVSKQEELDDTDGVELEIEKANEVFQMF